MRLCRVCRHAQEIRLRRRRRPKTVGGRCFSEFNHKSRFCRQNVTGKEQDHSDGGCLAADSAKYQMKTRGIVPTNHCRPVWCMQPFRQRHEVVPVLVTLCDSCLLPACVENAKRSHFPRVSADSDSTVSAADGSLERLFAHMTSHRHTRGAR